MFDQATLAQLEAGYQSNRPRQQAAQQIAKPKASGAKRFIANLLPTVAGAVGAVGGSLVAPVAGTAAGGAAGSALGAALKQRILGEKTNYAEIGKEAAFGAVPGVFKGAKAGVQAVKGAKAAKEASTAGRAAQQIAGQAKTATPAAPTTTVTTESVKPTLLSKLSTAATKRGSGIKTDPAVGGIERADEAAQTFQKLGITGSPSQQLRKINQTMASHGKQVDDILAKNPIQLDGTAVRTQVEKAVSDPLKYAELDLSTPGAQRALTAHLNKFAEAKTAKEVNDYVKVLNKVATRAKAKLDKGGTLTDKESAALAAKRSGDEVLSQYPEIAPLKRDMAMLFERNADVTRASEKTVGIPILGIKSKAAAQTGAAIASRTGAVTAGSTNAATNPSMKRQVAGALFGQWGTRAIGQPLLEDQSKNNPTTQNAENITSETTTIPASNSTIPPLNDSGAPDASTSSFFSDPAQVEQAYLQALNSGDSETANALIKGFELFGQSASGGATKPLSAEAAKVVSNAQTGIQALQDFNSLIESDPSAFARTNIPGVGVLDKVTAGRASGALGTSGLNAARQQVIDIIARLRTGAAITNDEAARFEQFVPQPGDPPEVRQQKTNYLMSQFQMVAQRSGSAGTELEQMAATSESM